MLISKKIGAGKVAIIDFILDRLKEALKFGADFIIDGNSSEWTAEIFRFIGKNGSDHVVTAAPSLLL